VDVVSREGMSLPSGRVAKAIRESAGVSQEALAQVLGVSRVAVSRYEHGRRRPRRSLAVHYVEILQALQQVTGRAVQS